LGASSGFPVQGRRRRRLSFLIAALLVIGTVDWRRGAYFSGSLDPVVVAKAAVTLLALLLAFAMAQQSPARRRLGTGSLWWLGVVLGSSVFGALGAGTFLAGAVVAVRVAIVGATVFFLLRAVPVEQLLGDVAWACAGVAVVSAGTGLPTLSSGRLAGGIPAMDPNALALLTGVVVVLLGWRAVMGRAGWPSAAAAVAFLGVMWVTGSRTAVLMLLLGVLVMLLHIRRPRVGLVVGGLVLVAVAAVAAVTTGAVSGFAERNGTGADSLDSRFVAWRAALSLADTFWRTAFGSGLSMKIIPVHGPWRDTQPLDSSWVSLFVQAGVLGLAVSAAWVGWVVRNACRAPHRHRVLFLGLVIFLVGRSLLESGLFDATPAFVLFLAVSLAAEGGSRDRLAAEAAVPDAGPGARVAA
jgi:O-antigen ligase